MPWKGQPQIKVCNERLLRHHAGALNRIRFAGASLQWFSGRERTRPDPSTVCVGDGNAANQNLCVTADDVCQLVDSKGARCASRHRAARRLRRHDRSASGATADMARRHAAGCPSRLDGNGGIYSRRGVQKVAKLHQYGPVVCAQSPVSARQLRSTCRQHKEERSGPTGTGVRHLPIPVTSRGAT